jgi:hypothetical protein
VGLGKQGYEANHQCCVADKRKVSV